MPNQSGIDDHSGKNAEKLAAGYKNINRKNVFPALYEFLTTVSEEEVSMRVLDVGCGAGNDAIEMAKLGHKVMGIEPSDLREIAIRDHSHKHIEYRDDQLPALSTLQEEEPFDVVLMSAVLQYVDPAERVESLKTIARTMAPSAKLFVNYPSPPSREHQYEITPEQLHKDIEEANAQLPEEQRLAISGESAIIPDSRGRTSLDGRPLNFYSFTIQKSAEKERVEGQPESNDLSAPEWQGLQQSDSREIA